MFVVAMLLVLVTIIWKRWRHLFAFLGSIVVLKVGHAASCWPMRSPRSA